MMIPLLDMKQFTEYLFGIHQLLWLCFVVIAEAYLLLTKGLEYAYLIVVLDEIDILLFQNYCFQLISYIFLKGICHLLICEYCDIFWSTDKRDTFISRKFRIPITWVHATKNCLFENQNASMPSVLSWVWGTELIVSSCPHNFFFPYKAVLIISIKYTTKML